MMVTTRRRKELSKFTILQEERNDFKIFFTFSCFSFALAKLKENCCFKVLPFRITIFINESNIGWEIKLFKLEGW